MMTTTSYRVLRIHSDIPIRPKIQLLGNILLLILYKDGLLRVFFHLLVITIRGVGHRL